MTDYRDVGESTPAARVARDASSTTPAIEAPSVELGPIKMSEAFDKVVAALIAAQGELPIVNKGGENTYDKYSYARLEDYVTTVRPFLAKHGLGLIATPLRVDRVGERKTSTGKGELVVAVTILVRLFHTSGQWIEIGMVGDGQDRGDKAIYKALTGARKYAMACLLGAATGDDPEEDSRSPAESKGESGQQEPSAPPAKRAYREDVLRLLKLLENVPLRPNQTIDQLKGAWLARAGATDWNGLTPEQVKLGMEWGAARIAEGKPAPVPAASPAPENTDALKLDAKKAIAGAAADPERTIDPAESQVAPRKDTGKEAPKPGARKKHHPAGVDVAGWVCAWKETKGSGNERDAFATIAGEPFLPTKATGTYKSEDGTWFEMPGGIGVWASLGKHDSAVWRKAAAPQEQAP